MFTLDWDQISTLAWAGCRQWVNHIKPVNSEEETYSQTQDLIKLTETCACLTHPVLGVLSIISIVVGSAVS